MAIFLDFAFSYSCLYTLHPTPYTPIYRVDKRWIVVVLCSFCYLIVRQCDSETVVFKNIIRAYIYISFRNVLSHCLTVSLSQDGLTALSPPCQTMRKVLDNHGVITGKTAEKQGKCTLGLFPRAYSCLYTLHPPDREVRREIHIYFCKFAESVLLSLFFL